jgi:putative endonuclease
MIRIEKRGSWPMNRRESEPGPTPAGGKRTKQETGKLGEQAAFRYLEAEGYEVIVCNWRCRSGEIDIIARQEERIVFVEVRTRRAGGKFGTAAESVDYRKQRKIRDTAQVYLRSIGRQAAAIRFDVITVLLTAEQGEPGVTCRHYPAAF